MAYANEDFYWDNNTAKLSVHSADDNKTSMTIIDAHRKLSLRTVFYSLNVWW